MALMIVTSPCSQRLLFEVWNIWGQRIKTRRTKGVKEDLGEGKEKLVSLHRKLDDRCRSAIDEVLSVREVGKGSLPTTIKGIAHFAYHLIRLLSKWLKQSVIRISGSLRSPIIWPTASILGKQSDRMTSKMGRSFNRWETFFTNFCHRQDILTDQVEKAKEIAQETQQEIWGFLLSRLDSLALSDLTTLSGNQRPTCWSNTNRDRPAVVSGNHPMVDSPMTVQLTPPMDDAEAGDIKII